MRLPFPYKGLHEGVAAAEQPPATSPVLQNVRAFSAADEASSESEQLSGGQRPGLEKAYTTQVGGTHPIIAMAVITTMYKEPES